MPYFECQGCGDMANLSRFDRRQVRQPCPSCGEETTWRVSFESEEGVSF